MKFFIIFFLFYYTLAALEVSTRYNVYATMFGHVGYCDVDIREDKEQYEIKAVAKTIDTAAVLLRNRVETFISRGKIKNGKYIPDIFIKTKETTKKTRVQTYSFNHDKEEVILVEEKINVVNKMSFDSKSFKFALKEVEERSTKEEVLDNYMADDTLSIYLNSKNGCDFSQKKHAIIAIGANNDKNNIHYECLEGMKKSVAVKKLSDSVFLKNIYNLHVEPLDKDDKIVDVVVAYDNDGFLKEGLMDKIFWVGSMRAIRVNHKILKN